MTDKPQNNLLRFLNDYWKVLAFAVVLIIGWTQIQSSTKANADDIDLLQGQQAEQLKVNQQILTNLAEINTSIKFIEKQLK